MPDGVNSHIPRKSLRKRLVWQFSAFVTITMALITVIVVFMLARALTQELKSILSVNAYNSLKSIEQRVAFSAENVKNLSRNHFIINSLIDPQGRTLYLPKLIQDFSITQDVDSATIVDFEGNVIQSTLEKPSDYWKMTNMRKTLAEGKPQVLMFEELKNIVIIEPIEYYNTPQGAILVEFDLADIASKVLPKEENIFYTLFFKDRFLFSQNIKKDESYISVKHKAEKDFFYMTRLGIGIETGVLKKEYFKPVWNAIFQLILIALFFIAVAISITVKIGDSIASPVLKLCEKIKRSEKLEGEKCSPVGTGDELEDLARVFDDRTERLISAREHLEKHAVELKTSNELLKREVVERKRAEEQLRTSLDEKKLLLKEVHHRVKNNMQVISSMLMLQSSFITDKKMIDILQKARGRIKSMALVHEKIYLDKELSSINFREYIKTLTDSLYSFSADSKKDIEMKIDAEELFLDIDTTIPLGLIINELVSNAFKHAFNGKNKGEISLGFRKVNDSELRLFVKDNGVGMPENFDIYNSDSLGLQIVTLLVKQQLKGTIDLLKKDEGTEFKMILKKVNYKRI